MYYSLNCSRQKLKGVLNNFNLIFQLFFFFKWDFQTSRSVFVCRNCIPILTCNFNSVSKIYQVWFWQLFLKVDFYKLLSLSWLLNFEPATTNLVLRKFLKLLCWILWTDTKINWPMCKLIIIMIIIVIVWFRITMF